MASAIKLVLEFNDEAGTTRRWNFSNAKNSATKTQVKTLVNSLIENGSIFEHPPVKALSARFVVTTETAVELE